MGFFSTQSDANGQPQFMVSHNWWFFLALAVPMTAFTMLSMVVGIAWQRWSEKRMHLDLARH